MTHQIDATGGRLSRLEKQLSLYDALDRELTQGISLYRFMVENSHIGILIIDDAFNVVYGNNELVNIVGYPLSEIIGSDFRTYLADECKTVVTQRYTSRQKGDILPDRYEADIFRKDGTRRTVEISAAVTRTIAEHVLTVVQIFDITRRKQVEAELVKSEEKYRTILQNIEDLYFEVDLNGRLTFFNNAWVRSIGYGDAELMGMHYAEYVVPADVQAVFTFFNRVFRTGEIGRGLNCRIRGKDRSVIHIETTSTLITDDRATPVGFRGISRDVTERMRSERILRESEQKSREIIEGTPIPTFVIDHAHRVIHWNEACEKLTGVGAAAVTGTGDHWKSFYAEQRPLLADLVVDRAPREVIRKYYGKQCRISAVVKEAFEGEYFFPRLSPKGRWLFLTAAPLTGPDGSITGAIETLLDITEKKQAEKNLLKLYDALEEKVKERTRSLEEANIAMKVLLKKREDDRRDLEEQMLFNIREIITPYIDRLKGTALKERQGVLLEIIKQNLEDVASPFMRGLSDTLHKLTPSEIGVINLIKQGQTSKEIADFMGISPRTVEFHRDNIRKKLGITSKKINLRSWLLSIR